jgi:alkaline phosphatase
MKSKIIPLILVALLFVGYGCGSNTSSEASDPQVKNVIFLIGDGMGLNQVLAAMTVKKDALAMEQATAVGLQKTHSANKYITDSAASGTALACGKKTNNGMIGVDPEQKPLESILKVAERFGLATGLVSTSAITHATPASFIANDTSRNNYEAIAADFLETDIDVFIGGGLKHFSEREDGRDLTDELRQKGYTVATDMESVESFTEGKLAALTAPEHNSRVSEDRDDMLSIATKKAIELLSQDEDGFFLMVEGSQIDWGGHANDESYVVEETLDFDKAVGEAIEFARQNGETLVVVTADHETGGMIVLKGDRGEGTISTTFTTGGHTASLLPVFAYGPGAELFSGIYENTGFKERFIKAYGFPQ